MKIHKNKIGIVIYANPDHYPSVINATQILAKEFDLIIICRNQGKPQIDYPPNAKLYRLGRLNMPWEKQTQHLAMKICEYTLFSLRAIFYIRFYRCCLIYSYDMHGFVSAFFASRLGRRIALLYHNFDLVTKEEAGGLSYIVKYLELKFARYADKIIFPDINRAKFFQSRAKLNKLPDIVINTPLCINQLPSNKLNGVLIKHGINHDTKIVLYQGVICEGHSVLGIIKSMVFWPKNTILVLIGWISSDFLDNIYNTAGSLNLTKRIIYIPEILYSELFSYTVGAYLGLALYKSTSINQTFNAGASNKLFEYLSLGIPAITNNSPYFREVIDSSIAYFANPDSIDDIAKAINSAFSDAEEYHRKSQVARQAHLTKFNYEEQFKPIIECIGEITK